jgi:murein DD-endopeptidase MepM/ murein hydrolase activator NlpD
VSDRYELTLRLEKGDTVDKMLADIDVPEADRKQIHERLNALLKKKKLAVGEEIELLLQNVPEHPDAPRVLSLSVRPQPEREFIITRRDDGTYDGEEKVYKVSPRIVRVEAERHGSLEQSGVRMGVPSPAMVEFIRALSYDVDFQRELKEGMKFTVLLEQLVTSDGRVTHPGRLLAGELRLLKRTVTVIRYRPQGGADGFYNPNGESVVRAFLRTPMDASKISSRFGMREHPILGYSALHAGVDFAAPPGTPILAAGAGKVAMAGPNGGYGLYVKLQHTKRRRHRLRTHVAHRSGHQAGRLGAPGPGDRLRRLDRHVDRAAPALRVPSWRQAGQPAGPEVRDARAGGRQGRGALPRPGEAVPRPAQERAGRGGRQAEGAAAGREGRLSGARYYRWHSRPPGTGTT